MIVVNPDHLPTLTRLSNGATVKVRSYGDFGYGAGIGLEAWRDSPTEGFASPQAESFVLEFKRGDASFTFTGICEVDGRKLTFFMVDDNGERVPPWDVKVSEDRSTVTIQRL
jgi:hypothetical protein